jgi:predicted DNA-binding antitoxin AbrB/MazE fold protein
MTYAIKSRYENGVFRPLQKLDFPEYKEVEIIITSESTNDIPPSLLLKVAEQGGSYDFLANPEEDIYTIEDGEEV